MVDGLFHIVKIRFAKPELADAQHGKNQAKRGHCAHVLERLPKGPADPDLLIGFDSRDDAAVYRVSDELAIVQTLDFFPPMVDDPYTFGQIAAANALSDVYAMGGEVKTALNIVCFPETMDLNVLGEILRGGAEKVIEAGGTLVGGHSIADSDVKYGLSVTGFVNPANMNLSFSWLGLRNYLVIFGVFLAIDAVWLMVIAKKLYAKYLGYLMAAKPNLLAALLFYVVFVIGLQAFVVQPALAAGSVKTALISGMLFGLVAYATYDLTNLATVRDWPVLITLVDLAWGTFVSGATATIGYLIIRAL